VRGLAGLEYWSLAGFAKKHVKAAVSIVSDFETSVARECRRRRFDGVICGHIHAAEIRQIDGITYHNCGDWVDSCTALAEDHDGRIRILRWSQLETLRTSELAKLPPASTSLAA
jgi:UDP-2,3-diacylglucosamine pyrophosphatase LpxH